MTTVPVSVEACLTALPPVALAEVNRAAGLSTRFDRKHLLSLARVPELLEAAAETGAQVLDVDGRRIFAYESTYFDTPQLESHLAAALGRRRRFKVRTRRYRDTGESWLEVKSRGPRGVTVKERLPLPAGQCRSLGNEAADFVTSRLEAAGVDGVDVRALRPILTTRYRRLCLLLPTSGARVTVDLDLEWSTADHGRAWTNRLAVVETKNPPGRLSEIDHALWALGHRPVRLSKYGSGLALLRSDVCSHRWHRTLHRHLVPDVSMADLEVCA